MNYRKPLRSARTSNKRNIMPRTPATPKGPLKVCAIGARPGQATTYPAAKLVLGGKMHLAPPGNAVRIGIVLTLFCDLLLWQPCRSRAKHSSSGALCNERA
jgi:hypothetical protein